MYFYKYLILLAVFLMGACSSGETGPQNSPAQAGSGSESGVPPATGSLNLAPPGSGLPPDGDADSDGVSNALDTCPQDFNPPSVDSDGDGHPDQQSDLDRDGLGDTCDNCPSIPNSNQADSNDDGIGDTCQEGGPSSPPEEPRPDLAPLF